MSDKEEAGWCSMEQSIEDTLNKAAAEFLGYTVRPLSWFDARDGGWYPFARDRSILTIRRWMVPDPLDPVCYIEGEYPPRPPGDWWPCFLPQYSRYHHEAWNVFEWISRVDRTAFIKGKAVHVLTYRADYGPTEILEGATVCQSIVMAAQYLLSRGFKCDPKEPNERD